jgi:hypothetical protein
MAMHNWSSSSQVAETEGSGMQFSLGLPT